MGAKASLVEATGPNSRTAPPSTLENIKAAYEGGDKETARELIQQACCVECSGGIHPDGVSHYHYKVKSVWRASYKTLLLKS